MYHFVSILIIFVSVLLVLVVLVQNSKGGGLASNFSGSNQVMGVRKTTDFVEKATWTLISTLFVLSFVAVMFLPKETVGGAEIDSKVKALPTQQTEAPDFKTSPEAEQEAQQ